MKANDLERKKFDNALDDILDLFNNLEDDEPIIKFADDVMENIEFAKKKYGDETVDEKINTLVREMLSWLDLEDAESEEEKEEQEEET
ncbi:voltage-gated potassium channel [Oceanobacillus limi]|uniref:Voltage-gated potassium channel n=1 Tax=Oceanobacillus limi TaxID=930131 RepID=A0A1I0CD54_9BACI|nr:atypical membrane-integrating protein (Mistic protein) [Oceanobacillus limi]SET17486.1 voltage-gated potassium channel [Oceanobacillus limi]